MTILEEVINLQLPLIIGLNKVDKLSQTQINEYHRIIQISFQFAKYIPIIDLSAQTGKGVNTMFDILQRLRQERDEHISTPDLNKIIRTALVQRPPRFPKNKACKISYITQVENQPPTFIVFVNDTKRATSAFKKWLENTIRLHSPFVGKPLRIFWRNKRKEEQATE
jgi:GTP-binding protein